MYIANVNSEYSEGKDKDRDKQPVMPPYFKIIPLPPSPEQTEDEEGGMEYPPIKRRRNNPPDKKKRPWDNPPIQLEGIL